MPLATGINHIATLTTDMDRTVAFYASAFGAEVTHEVPRSDDHPWMKVVHLGGGASLNVFEVGPDDIIGDRARIGARGAIDHFGIAVESEDALRGLEARLRDAGADVGQVQQLGHELSLFFRDPDGMELEVCYAAP